MSRAACPAAVSYCPLGVDLARRAERLVSMAAVFYCPLGVRSRGRCGCSVQNERLANARVLQTFAPRRVEAPGAPVSDSGGVPRSQSWSESPARGTLSYLGGSSNRESAGEPRAQAPRRPRAGRRYRRGRSRGLLDGREAFLEGAVRRQNGLRRFFKLVEDEGVGAEAPDANADAEGQGPAEEGGGRHCVCSRSALWCGSLADFAAVTTTTRCCSCNT